MASGLPDAPVCQVEDAVGHADCGEAVADQERHAVAGEFAEARVNLVLGLHVERGGGFVEDKDLGVAQIGSGQGQFLPLSVRELAPAEGASQLRVQPIGKLAQQLGGAGALRGG